MGNWGLWEIISDKAKQVLIEYQWKHYGTKLDKPLAFFDEEAERPVHYPSIPEIEKEMKRKPTRMRRVA